jgi:iron complex outermembrane receptor protein
MGAATVAAVPGAVTMGSGTQAKAHAGISAADITDSIKAYKIASGPVAQALVRLADENNVQLIYKAPLTLELRTRGLSGRHTLRDALDKVLAGTGLDYRLAEDGKAVTIQLAQAATGNRSDTTRSGCRRSMWKDSKVVAEATEGATVRHRFS